MIKRTLAATAVAAMLSTPTTADDDYDINRAMSDRAMSCFVYFRTVYSVLESKNPKDELLETLTLMKRVTLRKALDHGRKLGMSDEQIGQKVLRIEQRRVRKGKGDLKQVFIHDHPILGEKCNAHAEKWAMEFK